MKSLFSFVLFLSFSTTLLSLPTPNALAEGGCSGGGGGGGDGQNVNRVFCDMGGTITIYCEADHWISIQQDFTNYELCNGSSPDEVSRLFTTYCGSASTF